MLRPDGLLGGDVVRCFAMWHLCFCVEAVGLDVFAYKADDFFGGGAGAEAALDALCFDGWDVFVGEDATGGYEYVVDGVFFEEFHDTWEECHVGTGEDAHEDCVYVFLDCGFDDHFGCLTDAGVDNFHACIA